MDHIACKLCKKWIFLKYRAIKDENKENKLLVQKSDVSNIQITNNGIHCKRCNANIGKAIKHKVFYEFDRRQLVEIMKNQAGNKINKIFHTCDSDFSDTDDE